MVPLLFQGSWYVHLVPTYWGLIPIVRSGSGPGWPIPRTHQSLENGHINEQMNFFLNLASTEYEQLILIVQRTQFAFEEF